jgi:diguanylate cyclase (GGDEF)-like protein
MRKIKKNSGDFYVLKNTAVLVFLLYLINPVYSQELPVIHYGINEGLDSVIINHLDQDADGRLWIAHHAGISVYDGYQFHNWNRKHGMLSNAPSSITAGDNGIIWILYADLGLQYLTPEGQIFTVPDPEDCFLTDRIPFLFKLKDGRILAGGKKGYYYINRKSIQGPHYPVPGKYGAVYSILDRGEKGLAAATSNGIYLLNDNRAEKMSLPYDRLGTEVISDLSQDESGNLWLLTQNGLIARAGPDDLDFWRLPFESNGNPNLFSLRCAKDNSVWIASGNGLFRWKEGKINRFSEEQGLIGSWINCLLVDRDGVLWLGAEGGLDKIAHMGFRNYRYRHDFPVNAVWAVAELPDGTIWLGTNRGILAISPNGENHRIYTADHGLIDNSVIDLDITENGEVWVLTYNGVCFWNGRTFIAYPSDELKSIGLYNLLPVHDNEIWISTTKGLYILKPESKTVQPHPLNEKIEHPDSLNFIYQARDGMIYLLGRSVYTYSQDKGLEKIQLPEWGQEVSLFKFVQGDDRLWFLSDSGLISFDGKTWKSYFTEDDVFFDLIHISDSDIWVGLNSGIAHFDGQKYQFFGHHDGIAVGECNLGASLLDSQGRVWLGGQNMTVIYSSETHNFPPSEPLITRVVIANKNYTMPKQLSFSSKARGIVFQFSTPSFFNEQDQVYRYRLIGLEYSWSNPTREHSIRYASLPPGQYQFKVQSRQKHGRWNGSIRSIPVEVVPTFTQTTLAKILLVLALLVAGFTGGAIRVIRLKNQRTKLKHLVDEQTEKIRSQRDQLAELARTDELTRIANRRYFYEILEKEMKLALRFHHTLCLAIFDVDEFKKFNDHYGHTLGDQVLHEIGTRSKQCTRESDTFARWGGDEFILLLYAASQENAVAICRRIQSQLQDQPVASEGKQLSFTLSTGVVCWDPKEKPDLTHQDLFRYADMALYRAKAEGRNRIKLHSQ